MIWELQFHSANLMMRFVMGNVFIKQTVVRVMLKGSENWMTDREKAIVMAYTGCAMLVGDKLGIYYQYVQEKLGRSVMTHELAYKEVQDAIRLAAKEDFIALAKDNNVPRNGWISVKEKLPEEHESIFYKLLGTPKWSNLMWKQESEKVLVCVSFLDGTEVVTTGCLHNSDWMTTVSRALPQTVTHWMPLPEPPKEENK